MDPGVYEVNGMWLDSRVKNWVGVDSLQKCEVSTSGLIPSPL